MFSRRLALTPLLVAVLPGGRCIAAELLDRTYIENAPTAELEPHVGCAHRVAGQLRINNEHLARNGREVVPVTLSDSEAAELISHPHSK
jgi:hypothetical protein